MTGRDHWDDRYASIGVESVSWFEAEPEVSLELLDLLGVTPDQSVIDVGGGASTLVHHILDRGHRDVAVLDVSGVALEAARARLDDPDRVTWIEQDLLTWKPPRTWGVWHDRGMLHFLLDDTERWAYAALLRRTVEPGGGFVIATFAEDGPTHCSALPVHRYAPDDLADLLGAVEVIERRHHVHHTPGGADQPFTWIAGRLLEESPADEHGA